MTNARCLAAAILGGGRAARFDGHDKSGLELGGATILQRILAAVRPAVTDIFAVGDRFGGAAREGLRIVEDVWPGNGALGGIYSAIVHSPCERTLVIGCDMPFVTTAFIERMAAIEADVVMPRDDRGYQPLCAIYGRACADDIRARLERGERHAATPPAGVRVVEIGPGELAAYDPEGLLFVNVNTPHDYERARRIVEAGRAPA